MKMTRLTKCALAIASIGVISFGSQASGTSLTFTDTHVVGTISPGAPADDSDVATYIDFMIGLPLGGSGNFSGQAETRSTNVFGSLPNAIVTNVDNTGTTFNIGSGLYTYLFAKYDGQNDLSLVWDVADLSGSITIPADGPLGHGLSGWELFGPNIPAAPDGGSTMLLLGAALSAVGLIRRKLS